MTIPYVNICYLARDTLHSVMFTLHLFFTLEL